MDILIIHQASKRSPHKIMIDDSIIEIQAEIACEDIACKSKFCWINASSGKHIVLTSVHFGTWVAAIVCDYTFSCRSTELIQLG